MNLCSRTNTTNRLVSIEKQEVVVLPKSISSIVTYNSTSGIFIVNKLVKTQYKYADGSIESVPILEGVFTSLDWRKDVSTAANKRIAILLKSDGMMTECKSGNPVYDEDYISLKQKISLID